MGVARHFTFRSIPVASIDDRETGIAKTDRVAPTPEYMPDVTCSRCGQTRSGFERAPFPGKIGARVVQEICQQCWSDWLKQQTMLINHYGLNVMDPQARAFLTNNMTAFLFKSGMGEDVDTTKKGTIQW